MGRPFSVSQNAAARLKISEMYRAGIKQDDIAASVIVSGKPISQATVSRIISELLVDWLKDGTFNVTEVKVAELQKINALELTYWDAWHRSIGLKNERNSAERESLTATGVVFSLKEDRIKKWREVGDPRYLAGVQWCIEQRCKILGIYEAEKREYDIPSLRSLTDFVQAMYADK